MTVVKIDPNQVHPPAAAYSHGILTSGPGQFLFVSGQLGIDQSGKSPSDFDGQAELCWRNILAILHDAGMTTDNLVKLTTFLTSMDNGPASGRIRSSHIGDARPASTIICVSALARPEWLIEIEAVAFKS